MSAVAVAMLVGTLPLGVAAEPEDYLEIELDDLGFDDDTAWTLVDDGPPLALRALARPGLPTDPVVLEVEGIDTMGFVAKVDGGRLEVLVDDVLVATLGFGESTRDIPLTLERHVITWRYVPLLVDDSVELVLHGARSLLPPALLYATKHMWSWCGAPPTFVLHFVVSALVARADLTLTYDGETMNVTVHSMVEGLTRHHWVYFETPPAPDGTPAIVNATYRDAMGRVWTIASEHLTRVRVEAPVNVWPSGWVYDLRPTVYAFTPCGYDTPTSLQLFVDGVDRTSPDARGIWSSYTFDHDLPFGETHTAKVVVTLANGSVVTQEVEFREGLDVMEFDVSRLALVWGEAYVTTPTTGVGEGVFANALGPHELAPIVEDLRGALDHDPSQPMLWPDGAHLRAVYAPLGILCPEVTPRRVTIEATCSPYDGDAPGFHDWVVPVAELVVTAPDGTKTAIPSAGQWAAASRLTLEPQRWVST